MDKPSEARKGGKWSIGIFRGSTPLSVSPIAGQELNPMLQADDITDVDASYVADPFLVLRDDAGWMFFEIKNRATRQGEIGLAICDGGRWTYRHSVLREPFHLSYPYVFEWDGSHFMVPESLEPGAVRLYRADPFPDRWMHEADLVYGRFADPSVVRFEDRWWMWVCSEPYRHDVLRLFHARRLHGPWREHPQSPIVEKDPRRARPAGRIILWNGRLIRFAQDCVPQYGTAVRALEIEVLSTRRYRECDYRNNPILSGSGTGWNSNGMHHIDAHPTPVGDWIASVDGWRFWPPPTDPPDG
jgi:hypothetical protein